MSTSISTMNIHYATKILVTHPHQLGDDPEGMQSIDITIIDKYGSEITINLFARNAADLIPEFCERKDLYKKAYEATTCPL